MIYRKDCQISQTILHGRDAILRVRDKWLIFNIIPQSWADVKYHVPTGFGFSPKASGFYPFGDATALAGEGGVGDVVWLIQAPAWNQTCHSTNDRCEALASLKGCFLCFCFSPPVFFHWAHHPPHSTIPPHPEKTYENRFTNTNNHLQFIQKISKLRFFYKVHNIVDHNLVNFLFFSLPL